MSEFLKPWYRVIRVFLLYQLALITSCFDFNNINILRSKVFVIGCGRSGTTLLGELLEGHPNAVYHFEPWHLWAAIDWRLDLTNFCVRSNAYAIVDESFYSEKAQVRFNRLFGVRSNENKNAFLVEKSPINAMRIGYLNCLVPGAYFIHIVRDGMAVVDSIEKLTNENTYKVALRKNNNTWWGVDFCKWEYLKKDGKQHGYFVDEVDTLTTVRQMAAYEWLVSLTEVEKRREHLGSRLIEILYKNLVANPEKILMKISVDCDLKNDDVWPSNMLHLIKNYNAQAEERVGLSLPPKMCEAFNLFQRKYGFTSYAHPLDN